MYYSKWEVLGQNRKGDYAAGSSSSDYSGLESTAMASGIWEEEAAYLIAAAPCLLKALKLAISKDMLTGETRDIAVRAIDKAERKE